GATKGMLLSAQAVVNSKPMASTWAAKAAASSLERGPSMVCASCGANRPLIVASCFSRSAMPGHPITRLSPCLSGQGVKERSGGDHAPRFEAHRPGCQALAGAGAGHADPVAGAEKRRVTAAQDVALVAGQ